MIYVDANYWIYWFDERLPEHRHILGVMRAAVHEGIILNTVTLMEVAHYFRHLPPREFWERVDRIQNLATLTLVSLDAEIARLAFEELMKHAKLGVSGRDSVILATMKATGIQRIATHNGIFRKIEGIEVVDPIPKGMGNHSPKSS